MATPSPDEKRRDPVEDMYAKAEEWELAADLCNWSAAVAFAYYVVAHVFHFAGDEIAKLIFVFFTFFAIGLSYLHRYLVLPRIDERRRILLIADSLDENFSFEQQRDYWTSAAPPSQLRFILSLAENTFFYSKLLDFSKGKLLSIAAILVISMLIALRAGTPEMVELVAVVLLCSESVGGRIVRSIWASQAFETLHSQCLGVLSEWPRKSERRQYAEVIRLFGAYESIKSRSSIRASKRTFEKLNPRLTEAWGAISANISASLVATTDGPTPIKKSGEPDDPYEDAARQLAG
jgi:hypothetical protein